MRDRQSETFEAIRRWLDGLGVGYRHVEHPETFTSEESARARGEPLRVGGKALLLKGGDDACRLVVMAASLKLDSGAARELFGVRRLRFATREELFELTGLVPGCVPPFGEPVLPFPLYVDESVLMNDRIAFNAGSLTHSLVLSVADYRRICGGTVCRVSQGELPPEQGAGRP